jgi:hypothetical protein
MRGSTDGTVIDPIVSAASKTAKDAGRLLHRFNFDPHPRRTRIIFGTKISLIAVAITSLAWMIGRKKSGSSS